MALRQSRKKGNTIKMKINNDIKMHLEYLGYASIPNEGENMNIFMRPGMPTIFIDQMNHNRLVIKSLYEYNKNGVSNRSGLLEYVNHLNKYSYISTYTVDNNTLGFSAIYTGLYDRIEFGQFMDAYEHDSTTLFDKTPETQVYLMEDCPEIDSDLMNLTTNKQFVA